MSTVEVTENKGKDEPRSDNVHYDYPARRRVEVVRIEQDGITVLAVGSVSQEDVAKHNLVYSGDGVVRITDVLLNNATRQLTAIIPDLQPISASQASLTPTSGIQDDDC